MNTTTIHLDPACEGSHRIAVTLDYRRADGLSERGLAFLSAALKACHVLKCDRCFRHHNQTADQSAATMRATEEAPCPPK